MIIKKKYTNIKKNDDIQVIGEISVEADAAKTAHDKIIVEQPLENSSDMQGGKKQEEQQQQKQQEKELPKKKSIDDLDLSLENITFEQREERREGTRRRGYRRMQDRNIISRARKDAISIKETAKQEGYKEGIEEAKKDLEDLKAKLAEFFNYKDEVFQKVSECIMDISVEMAKKIINKEIEADKEYIIPMIKGVVEEVNKVENKITLKVMPKDAGIVRDKISEVFSGNYFEAKISVVPDNEIKDGGVVVETSNGIIDARIETQLAIMENALKKLKENKG